jgi:hypothetical protein
MGQRGGYVMQLFLVHLKDLLTLFDYELRFSVISFLFSGN